MKIQISITDTYGKTYEKSWIINEKYQNKEWFLKNLPPDQYRKISSVLDRKAKNQKLCIIRRLIGELGEEIALNHLRHKGIEATHRAKISKKGGDLQLKKRLIDVKTTYYRYNSINVKQYYKNYVFARKRKLFFSCLAVYLKKEEERLIENPLSLFEEKTLKITFKVLLIANIDDNWLKKKHGQRRQFSVKDFIKEY